MDPTLKLHANVDVMEHSPLLRDTVTQLNVEARGDLPLIQGYFDNLKANYLPREAEVNYAHAARQAYIALGKLGHQSGADQGKCKFSNATVAQLVQCKRFHVYMKMNTTPRA